MDKLVWNWPNKVSIGLRLWVIGDAPSPFANRAKTSRLVGNETREGAAMSDKMWGKEPFWGLGSNGIRNGC